MITVPHRSRVFIKLGGHNAKLLRLKNIVHKMHKILVLNKKQRDTISLPFYINESVSCLNTIHHMKTHTWES